MGTTELAMGALVLVVTDGALVVAGLRLVRGDHAQSLQGLPLTQAFAACFLALVVHLLGAWCATAFLTNGQAAIGCVVTGIAPAIVFVLVLQESFATFGQNLVYGSAKEAAETANLSAARALLRRGDVPGAIREYRQSAARHPDSPEPLLALASLLEQQGDFLGCEPAQVAAAGRFHRGGRHVPGNHQPVQDGRRGATKGLGTPGHTARPTPP